MQGTGVSKAELALSALGVAGGSRAAHADPKKQRGFSPQGGFVSWINTFDKVQLEGFHSLTTPSLLQHL